MENMRFASPRKIRKARLALIKVIMKQLKDQLGLRGSRYCVRRDLGCGMSMESMDIRTTGYGLGIVSGLFFGEKRRLIEIDCACIGTSLESILQVETFDAEVIERTQSVIGNFLKEIDALFGDISYKHYGQHITEFDQAVGRNVEILRSAFRE